MGLSCARNTGIKQSNGDFLVFLDADDLILPEKLAVQSEYLRDHPEVDIVYSNSEWFVEDNIYDTRPVNFPIYEGDVLTNLIYGNFMHVNSIMVRRNKVLEVGMFDENLKELEDWDLWLRMVILGSKVGFTPGVFSKVRIRKGSMTSDQQRMNSTMVKVLEKNVNLLETEFAYKNDIINKGYHALSIYKLKLPNTNGYLKFLFNTTKSRGVKFFPIAIKSLFKYFFRPFLRQNQTTRDIERIWLKEDSIEKY